jgi:large subunit ribosomal protein L17
MKKKVYGRKLSRSRPAREALFSSLIRAMILNGKIVTTKAKAKAIQGDVDRMITMAKEGSLNSRKRALAYLDNAKEVTEILFRQVGPVFASRTSGFTRIINLPRRKGDNAKVVRMEWTDKVELKAKEKPAKKAKAEKKVKADKKPVKKEVKKEVKK